MVSVKAKRLAALSLLFAFNIAMICGIQSVKAAVYQSGSSGETVVTIQKKLIRWGYLDGEADGIYGPRTSAAIRRFQSVNGLKVDGIAGTETLAALGIFESQNTASNHQTAEVALLARVISAEARGEPYAGQVAVGAVILNRVEHPSFPATIAGVVYQPGAFSCMLDGQIDQPVAESSIRAAQEALNGSDPTDGAIYYFNPSTATSSWIWSRPLIKVIGQHRFCS